MDPTHAEATLRVAFRFCTRIGSDKAFTLHPAIYVKAGLHLCQPDKNGGRSPVKRATYLVHVTGAEDIQAIYTFREKDSG